MKFKTETAVGLFILIGLALFVYTSIRVTGWQSDADETYQIFGVFEDVSGLAVGSAVRIAGIQVGKIASIELVAGKAKVSLAINKKHQISNSSWARVRSIGVLGDKYLELVVGDVNDPPLKDSEQIIFVASGATVENLVGRLSQIMDDVQSITQALNQNFGADGGTRIDSIIDSLAGFSKNLELIVSENQSNIKRSVDGFSEFSENLAGLVAENREDVRALIAGLSKLIEQMEDDAPELVNELRVATKKLDKSLGNLESITGKIDRGEGTIGKLVNDDETVEGLNETLASLNQVLGQANTTTLDIGFQGEYLSSPKKVKSYLNLDIKPSRDHYYILQLVSGPDGKTTETKTSTITTTGVGVGATTQTVEEDEVESKQTFLFSAQIAKRYHNSLFRLGLFENTFGVGVDQYFGAKDQFKLSTEAWGFSREHNREKVGAHVKVGGSWRFYENFNLSLGGDDIAHQDTSKRSYFIGLGLSFNEDNLKYLAGSLPVGQLGQ